METTWISPKIIVGKEATGEFYFRRIGIENEIWSELTKGNNVLIAAPRRVGKTSIMKYITSENNNPDFKLIFKNVQGINEEIDFYKVIYELIISCLEGLKGWKNKLKDYYSKVGIAEISFSGSVKFETKEFDYLKALNDLIPQFEPDGETIVLLIDELPEVLHNLYKNGKKQDAHNILKNLRHWRQEPKFEKIRFVLAGSIGIHYIINLINGRPADINDLKTIHYLPLDDNEFDAYINTVTAGATISYLPKLKKYIKTKINYLVPYFVNLLIDEIDKTCRSKNQRKISTKDIDEAMTKVIKENHQFSDWKVRLSGYMPKADFDFVNDILIHIAHKDEISIQGIYDKAQKHTKTDVYMDFINDLEQDGYITKREDGKYIFISPFLKEFWKNNNPIYNG